MSHLGVPIIQDVSNVYNMSDSVVSLLQTNKLLVVCASLFDNFTDVFVQILFLNSLVSGKEQNLPEKSALLCTSYHDGSQWSRTLWRSGQFLIRNSKVRHIL